MRPLEIAYQPDQEEVIKYEWEIGSMVRVWVCVGKNVEGVFQRLEDQEPERVDIILADYEELMAEDIPTGKPANNFRPDDLWKYVDRDREKKKQAALEKNPDIPAPETLAPETPAPGVPE